MNTTLLPGTDLVLSPVCFGGSFSALSREKEAFWMFDRFADLGGNFFDTANVYGRWNPDGLNGGELLLGKWLRQCSCRDRMVIATKGAHPPLAHMDQSRLSPADIDSDLHDSLQALGLDTIPLYYLHRDDVSRPVGEIVETMNAQIRRGSLRHWGVSNWTVDRILAANAYAEAHGLQKPMANQPGWSLARTDAAKQPDQTMLPMDDGMLAMHRETGLPAIPYSSQARGYLTKLFSAPEKAEKMDLYRNAENMRRGQAAKTLAEAHGCTINQIVLAYLLHQPFPVIPVIGCAREEQLLDSIGGLDVHLTPEELSRLA